MVLRRVNFNEDGEIDTMPSRYVCSVLDEMRTAVKVGRIDMLVGLIEEIQVLVNRMEAKLVDYSDMGYDLRTARELKKSIKAMKETATEIEEKMGIFDSLDND
jgi:hypothetical protein